MRFVAVVCDLDDNDASLPHLCLFLFVCLFLCCCVVVVFVFGFSLIVFCCWFVCCCFFGGVVSFFYGRKLCEI